MAWRTRLPGAYGDCPLPPLSLSGLRHRMRAAFTGWAMVRARFFLINKPTSTGSSQIFFPHPPSLLQHITTSPCLSIHVGEEERIDDLLVTHQFMHPQSFSLIYPSCCRTVHLLMLLPGEAAFDGASVCDGSFACWTCPQFQT